eukprot:CAMPEP_0194501510 /NCGR_PEP_ID=MMETSP0253-20130528/22720_1 /TAXON_ID=2966 /ORGANISM="Noctiluca scintillans" /LENGTH=30 /DNA_ID= /DNA_START= /DNA_END= /DNA_ORIENTATION=
MTLKGDGSSHLGGCETGTFGTAESTVHTVV